MWFTNCILRIANSSLKKFAATGTPICNWILIESGHGGGQTFFFLPYGYGLVDFPSSSQKFNTLKSYETSSFVWCKISSLQMIKRFYVMLLYKEKVVNWKWMLKFFLYMKFFNNDCYCRVTLLVWTGQKLCCIISSIFLILCLMWWFRDGEMEKCWRDWKSFSIYSYLYHACWGLNKFWLVLPIWIFTCISERKLWSKIPKALI